MNSKHKLDDIRKDEYEKSIKFTRYIYIRYFLAVIFFSNLYWFASLGEMPIYIKLLPVSMMLCVFIAYFNLMRIHQHSNDSAEVIKLILKVNIIYSSGLILLNWINASYYFPIINENIISKLIFTGLFIIGIICSYLSIRHINKIACGLDMISKRLNSLKKYKI